MKLLKIIKVWWNILLCFLFGHTLTTICTRCGKLVDLQGTRRPTLEVRINGYFAKRKDHKLNPTKPEYKGSLKLIAGMKKYSINLKTNELRLVDYATETDLVLDKDGFPKLDKKGKAITRIKARKSEYDPFLMYIDASNDENAIRKANNYLRGVKRGVKVEEVSQ